MSDFDLHFDLAAARLLAGRLDPVKLRALKLGAASAFAVVPLSEISGILTERAADKARIKPFEKMKIAVIQA